MTLMQRQAHAAKKGAKPIAATIVHIMADRKMAESDADPFYLTLLLVTFMVYLYTRRWEWALVGFLVYYTVENVLFFAARTFDSYVGRWVLQHQSRTDELLTDPIIFALALLVAAYVFDASAFSVAAVPAGAIRTLAVSLAALASMFSRIFYLSLALLLATVWVVYFTQTAVPGALEQALAATITAIGLYLWFLRPINCHYVFNAVYALLYTVFFSAVLTGITMNL